MYIFIDTNVFYNNWFLKNADFKFLINFVENTDAVLLMSELVCEEVNNLHAREINAIVNNLENELRKSRKLTISNWDFDFSSLREKYDFKEVLSERTRLTKYFSYSEIRHEEVVKRAMSKIRPFQEEEKGYRDTLIWLSFLSFLKKNSITREVIFISNNKNDFFDGKRTDFHEDLKRDIQGFNLRCKISPFDSLYSFVTSQVDKTKHEYTYLELSEKYLHSIDEYLQDDAKHYLNQLSSEDFKNLLLNANESFPGIDFLIDHSFEIDEGVEDAEVLRYKIISKDLIYVNHTHNFRRCTLVLTIPTSSYELHRSVIDKNYYEIVIQGDQTTFSAFARVYLEVSFNYNTNGEFIEGYNILKADFSRR